MSANDTGERLITPDLVRFSPGQLNGVVPADATIRFRRFFCEKFLALMPSSFNDLRHKVITPVSQQVHNDTKS